MPKKTLDVGDQKLTFAPDLFIIPGTVMLDPDLQPLDSKVYATVYWLERLRDGRCYASNNTIAKVVGSSSSGVRQSLYRLEEKKYISMSYDENNHRTGIITLVQMRGGVANETGGVSEMRHKDNNTKKESMLSDLTDEQKDEIKKVYRNWLAYMLIDPEIRLHGSADDRRVALEEASKRYRLTTKRRELIARRLNDAGYQMLVRAISNLAKSPWHRDGDNDRGWKADLEFLCRSYEKVEEWSNRTGREEDMYS